MDKTIREHDAVVLLRDLPDAALVAGDSGIVVYAYDGAEAFEVEFANPMNKPRFIVRTVIAADLLKLQPRGHVARTVA